MTQADNMEHRTPIALITGALGSGKTTLLRHILSRTNRRLAVLMNEFGEIAIDSRVLPGANLRIIELAGGCVCCELTGEFEAAVNEIIELFHPDLIVVEATGVAEADSLACEVQDNLPQVRLDSVIHIIDAFASIEHPEIGYAARSQLQQADILLINKTDLVDMAALDAVELQTRRHNDRALLLRCVRGHVDQEMLFGIDIQRREVTRPLRPEPHMASFVFVSEKVLDRARFMRLVESLPPEIYRAKGFVRLDGEAHLFNYVAGRTDLVSFPADTTQLVFIGPGIENARASILARLRDCEG
jgi:G3E family GTPase